MEDIHGIGREPARVLNLEADHSSSRTLYYIAFFALIVAIAAVAGWSAIDGPYFEVGDFAANSVLIQRAKHFALFVGNYSRVGVNHPGPAILYVLAAGETLFFDLLHLVRSPFSGQLLAVVLYNAFWATLMLRGFDRMTRSLPLSFLLVSGFLLAALWVNARFFTSPWFPDLYFFPYAALVIYAARFAEGEADGLLPLALSAGFLFNAHVSFAPTLAIILAVVLAYNFVAFRKADPAHVILGKIYVRRNLRRLVPAVLLLGLFVLPLIIETILHFPGPIAQYESVAGQHAPNSLQEAVVYTARFWGGLAAFLPAFLLMAGWVAYGLVKGVSHRFRAAQAFAAALLAGILAMLFYAKFGVDMLDAVYIGLFSYALPLYFVAGLILLAYRFLPWEEPKGKVAIVLGFLFLAGFAPRVGMRPLDMMFYGSPAVADIADGLNKVGQGRRVVLESKADWSELVAAEAYAARRGEDLFCVNVGWHILFTQAARCTVEEVRDNPTFGVFDLKGAPPVRQASDFNAADLAFRKPSLLDIDSGLPFTIASTSERGQEALGQGWSMPAPGDSFAWQDAPEASLRVALHPGSHGTLSLDMMAFVPTQQQHQSIQILLNGKPAAEAVFTYDHNRQQVVVPVSVAADGVALLRIVDHDLLSPSAFGSGDRRTLGVAFQGIQFHPQ